MDLLRRKPLFDSIVRSLHLLSHPDDGFVIAQQREQPSGKSNGEARRLSKVALFLTFQPGDSVVTGIIQRQNLWEVIWATSAEDRDSHSDAAYIAQVFATLRRKDSALPTIFRKCQKTISGRCRRVAQAYGLMPRNRGYGVVDIMGLRKLPRYEECEKELHKSHHIPADKTLWQYADQFLRNCSGADKFEAYGLFLVSFAYALLYVGPGLKDGSSTRGFSPEIYELLKNLADYAHGLDELRTVLDRAPSELEIMVTQLVTPAVEVQTKMSLTHCLNEWPAAQHKPKSLLDPADIETLLKKPIVANEGDLGLSQQSHQHPELRVALYLLQQQARGRIRRPYLPIPIGSSQPICIWCDIYLQTLQHCKNPYAWCREKIAYNVPNKMNYPETWIMPPVTIENRQVARIAGQTVRRSMATEIKTVFDAIEEVRHAEQGEPAESSAGSMDDLGRNPTENSEAQGGDATQRLTGSDQEAFEGRQDAEYVNHEEELAEAPHRHCCTSL